MSRPDEDDGGFDSDEQWDVEIAERTEKRRRLAQATQQLAVAVLATTIGQEESNILHEHNDDNEELQQQRTRATPQGSATVFVRDRESGAIIRMTAMMSPWYISYVESPRLSDSRWATKFRRRFRLSYHGYREVLRLVISNEGEEFFGRWTRQHHNTRSQSPIELLVLGALRYLGRGWTFDDLEEATGISEEVHRVFFHKFISFGKDVLFPLHVSLPSLSAEARSAEYESAGMLGCIGSMDATHVLCERIPYDQAQEHKGFKLTGTARTYNIVVNNRRRILSTTRGHPSRWNDKTLVKFDELAMSLRHGTCEQLDSHAFDLLERKEDGTITTCPYRGAWIIVDNGYLNWSCTVPPMKTTEKTVELRFSQWLESLRKDVECTFGILKGRFRVLKAGVRLHGVEACDKLWHTCCALHNMLLTIDGLDNDEEWLGENGRFSEEDIRDAVPFALHRLHNPGALRNYDSSGMGVGSDRYVDNQYDGNGDDDNDNDDHAPVTVDEEVVASLDGEGYRRVRFLSLQTFRAKVIEHFDILYQQNKLVWPCRNKNS